MDLPLETAYFRTNGIRIHAKVAGPEDGKCIILLHGFPEFWYGWDKYIRPLAEAGFRVLAPDQRGYNLSDKPQNLEAYRLDETTKDILGLIDALGREKASVVGHDWGGIVAWWLARHYPERIERLAILNAPHPAVMKRTLLLNPAQVLKSSYALFFQLPHLPEAILRNNDWELVVKGLHGSSRAGTFTEADIEQYRQAWWKPGAFTAMLNWYRANFRLPPEIPADGRIHVPTLIIWGARDVALSREMAGLSADLCQDHRLVIFEGASHWVQHEQAARVKALLLGFLNKQNSGG
jgi:pimeloyl-ACP methyl ester carboxylesterase